MRFLHTADWHVGKGLQGRSRVEEHEEVLREIVSIARDREVDATLVAGDLFDGASPPPEAERVVYATLLELAKVGPVVLVPGNHDNERRLAALRDLLGLAEVHVVPFIREEPLELEVSGRHAMIAALPWISQRYIVTAEKLMSLDASELVGEFGDRLRRVVEKVTACFTPETVNVLVGHVTIAGGQMGGGERTAQTIFSYFIDAAAFPASAHYVALGHLHKAQSFPAKCPVHYSGAPLHLDFSDDEGPRSVNLVEAAPKTPAHVERVELKSGRRLRTIEGSLEQLKALVNETGDDYLRVKVKEKSRTGLGEEVREMFPDAVKVLVDPGDREAARITERLEGKRPPHELFHEYLAEREVDDPALVSLFREIYEEVAS